MAARRATYGTRPDFREGMELRPREARIGELSAFDGSAWLTCGGTSVVVGVSGPVAPPRPTLERPDEAVVTVALQRSQGVPSAGAASKLLADRRKEQRAAHDTALTECVRQAMSAVILLREYPRSVFAFAIHVLSDDGSLLSVALNAAMVALMDAGVSCRTTVAAASIALAALAATETMPPRTFLWTRPRTRRRRAGPWRHSRTCCLPTVAAWWRRALRTVAAPL
jgi:ribonuclease PH